MMKKRILPLLLVLCLTLGLTAPALAAESAAAIRLSKTTGAVTVSKSSDKSLTLMNNMRLYNGYHVTTSDKSYAWMNLDDAKLIKEDAASEVEVRKSGKKLEVHTLSGSVFFDVSEKLEDDESLNISTSTMIVGIRGTAGIVEVVDRWNVKLTVLEGEVQCSVADPVTGQIKVEPVQAGETVLCVVYPPDTPGDKCDILREKWTVDTLPGYVLYDVVRDMDLCDKILDDTGIDIPQELAKEAGGDPSGRVPDRESATPEVLGEVKRRQDSDESDHQEKQDAVDEAAEEQENNHVSPDKVFDEQPSETSSDGGSSGGGSSTPISTTATMPVTAADLQQMLNTYNTVNLQPGGAGSDTLAVDTPLTVPANKTLAVQNGVGVQVSNGQNLQVDGTLTGENLTSDGTVTVNSSNTLQLSGDLTVSDTGTLQVTSTGRVVVDGTLTVNGTPDLTKGAQVLAGTFGGAITALDSWRNSDAVVDGSHYQLNYTGPFAITFDTNGGRFEVGGPTYTTDTDTAGVLVDGGPTNLFRPSDTAEYAFAGWFTDPTGGTQIEDLENYTFTADTTLYAHWTTIAYTGDGWRYVIGNKELQITDDVEMADYAVGEAKPWDAYSSQVTNISIEETVTKIGDNAFTGCANLTSVVINTSYIGNTSSLETIGAGAFAGCTNLTSIAIPEGPTGTSIAIGAGAFEGCTGLSYVMIPATIGSIDDSAFSGCTNLSTVYYRGEEAELQGKITNYDTVFPNGATFTGNSFIITFYADGGTFADGTDLMILCTQTDGTLATIPDAPTHPDGAAFRGWFDWVETGYGGGKQVDTSYVFTEDLTVYAYWTATA